METIEINLNDNFDNIELKLKLRNSSLPSYIKEICKILSNTLDEISFLKLDELKMRLDKLSEYIIKKYNLIEADFFFTFSDTFPGHKILFTSIEKIEYMNTRHTIIFTI